MKGENSKTTPGFRKHVTGSKVYIQTEREIRGIHNKLLTKIFYR